MATLSNRKTKKAPIPSTSAWIDEVAESSPIDDLSELEKAVVEEFRLQNNNPRSLEIISEYDGMESLFVSPEKIRALEKEAADSEIGRAVRASFVWRLTLIMTIVFFDMVLIWIHDFFLSTQIESVVSRIVAAIPFAANVQLLIKIWVPYMRS